MTQSHTGIDTPRSSRPVGHTVSTWALLVRRAAGAFLREGRARGWSPAFHSLTARVLRRGSAGIGRWFPVDHRSPSRVFCPSVDGQLEARALLSGFSSPFGKNYLAESAFLLKHPMPRAARNLHAPPQLSHNTVHFNNVRGFRQIRFIGTQNARGGQAVEVTATDGSHYRLKLSYTSNTIATNVAEGANGQGGVSTSGAVVSQVSMQNANYPQPIGTIRAYPMSGGRVGIIVDGTTNNVELTINPLGEPQKKGFAHSFAYGESNRTHILNIGKLTVNSGEIGAVLGFQTADLSGPLVAKGTTPIDRIAFDALLPGASITTGGDLNTLDVLNEINLSGSGTGIFVGRDLNLLNAGSTITLSNGASINVARDLGLINQPPKGTGSGSNVLLLNFNTLTTTTINGQVLPQAVSTFIQGSVVINPGSVISVGRSIDNVGYIEGSITGFSRFLVNAATAPTNPTFLLTLPPSTSITPTKNTVTVLGGGTP